MKTNGKSKFRLVYGGLVVAALCLVVFSEIFNAGNLVGSRHLSDQETTAVQLGKNAYLASAFNNFKKEKLAIGTYNDSKLSDKVLFKVFVKYMKEKEAK